jgi:hypothetical protein
MTVYLENCKISPSGLFEQRNKSLRGPCDTVRCAFFALIIWNRDDGTDGKTMVGTAPAPPAQCDSNRLKPVARKQVLLESDMVFLRESELDPHL